MPLTINALKAIKRPAVIALLVSFFAAFVIVFAIYIGVKILDTSPPAPSKVLSVERGPSTGRAAAKEMSSIASALKPPALARVGTAPTATPIPPAEEVTTAKADSPTKEVRKQKNKRRKRRARRTRSRVSGLKLAHGGSGRSHKAVHKSLGTVDPPSAWTPAQEAEVEREYEQLATRSAADVDTYDKTLDFYQRLLIESPASHMRSRRIPCAVVNSCQRMLEALQTTARRHNRMSARMVHRLAKLEKSYTITCPKLKVLLADIYQASRGTTDGFHCYSPGAKKAPTNHLATN